jgi:antitoxin component YwqK of YwqJK toxin-antitoxin module
MKTKLLTICILIILSGCSEQQTVNYSDTYEKDGVIYLKFSEPTPYTGNVTGEKKGFIKNGKKHHEFLKFYTSGELLTRINYKNGLRHGEHLRYCNNGDSRTERYFENDLPVGTHNRFECENNLLTDKHYKYLSEKYYQSNGKFFVLLKRYGVDGKIFRSYIYASVSETPQVLIYLGTATYFKNLRETTYKYHSNGKLKVSHEHKRNAEVYPQIIMKHGTSIWYDEDGNETKKKYYTNGKLTTSPPPPPCDDCLL